MKSLFPFLCTAACLACILSVTAVSNAQPTTSPTTPADDAAQAGGGYLFTTFKGEQTPMSEQVYFGLSRDGQAWQALNGGEPVLVSDVGEKGARDPFLIRKHDGSGFVLIATDLSIHLNPNWGRAVRDGSRAILIWESPDLVKWSGPRRVEVAPEDAGCTWAPQIIWDDQKESYLVYWASTTARDDFRKHRIWAARTIDFQSFSDPFVYIERPQAVIDTDIVRDPATGTYYRFSKDETTKAITMESADAVEGKWTPVEGFSLADLTGYEGPAAFQLRPGADGSPGDWALLLDFYSRGQGYQAWTTSDLASGNFVRSDAMSFPFRFRHGSVLPISAEEYERVQKAFAK